MTIEKVESSLHALRCYIEKEEFRGYDPYDALNFIINPQKLGKWAPILFIQFMKRNPFNIRKLIGIKKGYNPKAMGLFLSAYSLLFLHDSQPDYKKKMDFLFEWLLTNYSKGYSGYCWGYNFPWASPGKYLAANTPSGVVTAFVIRGIYHYYQATKDDRCPEIFKSAAAFVLQDLPRTENQSGLCISYTPIERDCCFNASLLAGEILACYYATNKDQSSLKVIEKIVDFTVDNQKEDGRWNYSMNPSTGAEREQIDFHQGFVLDSIHEIMKLTDMDKKEYKRAIQNGVVFYKTRQFSESGRAFWRLPKKWPANIHHLAQGIITFTRLRGLNVEYQDFAKRIAQWTIDRLQDKRGYFYYQKNRFYTIKIPYMRWAQAWMFLALTILLLSIKSEKF